MSRLRLRASIALVVALAAARTVAASDVEAHGESLRLELSQTGGEPVSWEACHPDCDSAVSRTAFGTPLAPPQLRIAVAGDPVLSRQIDQLSYGVERRDESDAVVLDFLSTALADGVAVRKTWRIPRQGYGSSLEVEVVGEQAEAFAREHPLDLELATGRSFEPPPGFGFAGRSQQISIVRVDRAGVTSLDPGADALPLASGDWSGVRNRFWALLVRTDAAANVASAAPGSVTVRLGPERVHVFHFYSGPIARGLLEATDPALGGLLFVQLWFWVRWIALGMLLLLNTLLTWVGNAGVSIVLLAVCVKLLMRPLSHTAERWQRGVNDTRSKLQPGIDEIKANFRGGERSQRLLELHREHGVSPFFGLKSMLGVLIQIPVFFAAYHVLDESFGLSNVGFLWIADLTEPDRFVVLPFAIPFFGDAINLLPFAMSAITILSSRLFDDGSLPAELLRKQRRSLYAMAFAFFVLFYSFPAGMVLYWTSNNLISLVWEAVARRFPRPRDRKWRLAVGTLRR